MHWILQRGFFPEHAWHALTGALDRFAIRYSVHEVVPKVGDLVPEPLLDHPNVICLGSYSMRHAAARNGWQPGVFDLYAQDFEQQRAHWGTWMLNFGSVVCTVEQAAFSDEQMFVRPTTDTKYFAGRVYTRQEFADWQRAVCDPTAPRTTSLTPQTRIQLSRPLAIFAEYRFWVVQGRIVTQSLYKRGGRLAHTEAVDERLVRFVEQRIAEWSPHETFVMDVCDTADGMRIVEINSLNSSGFYAADVQQLVLALEEAYTK